MKFYKEIIISLVICFCTTALSSEAPKVSTPKQKVAIVDSGIIITPETKKWLCEESYDATGEGLQDIDGHGTNIAGLITKGLDPNKVCLIIIKYNGSMNLLYNYEKALKYLLQISPNYVNMSYESSEFLDSEYETVKHLTENGTKVVVAAGNNKMDFSKECKIFPACLKIKENFYVVGAPDIELSNYGGPVKYLMPGFWQEGFGIKESGTSQSCANFLNYLLK